MSTADDGLFLKGMQGSFEGTRTASCTHGGMGGCWQACCVSGTPVLVRVERVTPASTAVLVRGKQKGISEELRGEV